MNVYQYTEKHNLLGRLDAALDRLRVSELDKICLHDHLEDWTVEINHRAKCRAGQIAYGPNILSLTHKFFECDSRKDDHIQTFLHELAHIITRHVYGRKDKYGRKIPAHGRQWKNVMVALGARPDRCHNYDYMGRSGHEPKHSYKCKDCDYEYLAFRALVRPEHRRHSQCKHKPNGGKLIHTQLR